MDNLFKIIAEFQDNASPGLEKLHGALGEVAKGFVAGAIVTAAGLVINKFAEMTQKAIDAGDEFNKLNEVVFWKSKSNNKTLLVIFVCVIFVSFYYKGLFLWNDILKRK